MKKLIYIANARIPTEKAHGLQIMEMCSAFASLKFDVELVVPKRINWLKEDPFKYYGIERNFKITRLFCLDLIPLDKYIGIIGLWVESFTFFVSVFFYTIFNSAGIFYTRDKFFLPLVLIKKNLIFEAHTFPNNYFLYSFFLKKIKKIIVITQKLKDLFVEWGIVQEKILVAPDGVDLRKFEIRSTKFETREKLGLPQDKKIVLYTGHLYDWKGVQTLAEASEYLDKDTIIVFVGGTKKDIQRFKSQISNLKSQILTIGHRPHSEISYWLKAADVLVLPNSGKEDISKFWTSPLKLFEYMASQKPIVASDLPSLREILNENNSVLVKPDNPEKLAGGIIKIIENTQLAQRISSQAFEEVQNYTWQKRVQNIFKFLNV